MTGSIEIAPALQDLERDFQSWLSTLPGDMSAVAAAALERMAIRPGRDPAWTQRLSPLVALYPALQAQAATSFDPAAVEDLGLAHLQLMAHAFLSDRQLDGQLVLTPEECVLSTQSLLEGAATLARHAPDGRESAAATLRHLRRHHAAQLLPYPDDDPADLEELAVFRHIADRAVLGWLATATLLERSPHLLEPAREAYDLLVVGLQWRDDVLDWEQDLHRAQENLLLRRLNLNVVDAIVERDVDLERRLIEEGVYAESFARIDRYIGRAAEMQRQLGAVQLAALIGELRLEMSGLRARLDGLIQGRAFGAGT
jgi:hypothetical protein